jgi:hypothetical protein
MLPSPFGEQGSFTPHRSFQGPRNPIFFSFYPFLLKEFYLGNQKPPDFFAQGPDI